MLCFCLTRPVWIYVLVKFSRHSIYTIFFTSCCQMWLFVHTTLKHNGSLVVQRLLNTLEYNLGRRHFISQDLHINVIVLHIAQQRVLWKYWPCRFNGCQLNIKTSPSDYSTTVAYQTVDILLLMVELSQAGWRTPSKRFYS